MILNYPEGVQHAARVLTALPVTQVSVERLFSASKIILSDARSRLKADLVEAILFCCVQIRKKSFLSFLENRPSQNDIKNSMFGCGINYGRLSIIYVSIFARYRLKEWIGSG